MLIKSHWLLWLALLTGVAHATSDTIMTQPTPPKATRHPHLLNTHGDARIDNYYWLRDDERSNPAVLDYLKAENAYTDAMLTPSRALRDRLYQEMVARIPQRDESVPYVKNGYRYQTRFEPGKEYAIYSRQGVTGEGAPQLLLDGNQQAEGHDYYAAGALEVSRDNRLLAVAEDFVSRRQYRVRLRDIESGQWLADTIDNTSGNIVWAADSKTLFYVRKHPQTLLPYQVYRHRVATKING